MVADSLKVLSFWLSVYPQTDEFPITFHLTWPSYLSVFWL